MGSRLYAYNAGAAIPGASQSGNLAISNNSAGGGSVKWWNGPNEDLGFTIAYVDTSGNRKTNGIPVAGNAVGFTRVNKDDSQFLSTVLSITGQSFLTASVASEWLNTNGYYTSFIPKLLDFYPGAIGGFSVRLLKASFSSQSPLRVRRTVDGVNVEADVFFNSLDIIGLDSLITIASGSSSATTLGSFVGATGYSNPDGLTQSTSAFVSIWRNQINPTNNLTTPTSTNSLNQPRLVNNGVLETSNNHPSLRFFYDGTNLSWFPSGATISNTVSSGGLTIFTIARSIDSTAGQTIANFSVLDLTTQALYVGQANSTALGGYIPGPGLVAYSNTVQGYEYAYWVTLDTSLGVRSFLSNVASTVATSSVFLAGTGSSAFTANRINIAARYSQSSITSNPIRGYVTEAIFYNSDQFNNRIAISQNQIDYYDSYYEPEYNKILNAAQSGLIGGSVIFGGPSEATRTKDNKLIKDLKSAGIWSKLDVFYMFSTDGNAPWSSINWINPGSNTATFINTPTFVSNSGLLGNGTNGYIQTNFNPVTQGVNYTQNNASRFAWIGNTASGAIDSAVFTGLQNSMTIANSTNQLINQGTTALPTSFEYTNTIGLKSIHRTSSTQVVLYNGTASETRTVTSSTMQNSIQYMLRANSVSSTLLIRCYGMGASLTQTEVETLNTALAERLA